MKRSTKKVKPKKRGRPATGNDAMMRFRMPKELTAAVEGWAIRQTDKPARSEAFRRLVELGLAASAMTVTTSPQARAKSAALAGEELDRLSDQSASVEEQASRKRRLIRGPGEFRNFRKDNPDKSENEPP
jgi:hypothetical protein